MGSTMMVRADIRAHQMLQELASHEGLSLHDMLTKVVEAYRRQRIVDETNAAYAALQTDPGAWREFQAEIASLDGVLGDGLEEGYEQHATIAPSQSVVST